MLQKPDLPQRDAHAVRPDDGEAGRFVIVAQLCAQTQALPRRRPRRNPRHRAWRCARPRRAPSRKTCSAVSAGVKMARWSGGSGKADEPGKHGAPQISVRLGLTGNTCPPKPKRCRLSQTRRDQWSSARSDAPTSTTLRGWNRRRSRPWLPSRGHAMALPARCIASCVRAQRSYARSMQRCRPGRAKREPGRGQLSGRLCELGSRLVAPGPSGPQADVRD